MHNISSSCTKSSLTGLFSRVHNSTQLTHLKFCTRVNKHLVNNVWRFFFWLRHTVFQCYPICLSTPFFGGHSVCATWHHYSVKTWINLYLDSSYVLRVMNLHLSKMSTNRYLHIYLWEGEDIITEVALVMFEQSIYTSYGYNNVVHTSFWIR